jgi:tRNA modification GTPase
VVLWLGSPEDAPDHTGLIRVAAQADVRTPSATADIVLSAKTGEGMAMLHGLLVAKARKLLPRAGEVALNRRQRAEIAAAHDALSAATVHDALLLAEALRIARLAFDRLTGRAGTEDMLDALFGRFCIGK